MLSLPLLLGFWQVLAMLAAHRLFPTPIAVAEAMATLALEGRLLEDLGKTLARALAGFGLAMALGIALGLALGRQAWLDRLFSAWLVVGLNLPAIIVAIVLFIWLGLTETALIAAVVINKVPLVIVTIREGVRSFSADYDELARALRLDWWTRLRRIHWPQLLPFMLAAARTGLSLIWKIVLVFEVLGSDGGVGYRVSVFFQFFDVTAILAYTTSFILVVLAFEYGILRVLERRAFAWRRA
ncbi:ABC transporter permease [Devosia elaeis]|uniref:ABC transporter permease n=1 Tax=Devosia elaeis TaxID=1770058 RepID=UPI000A5556FD|nr:ABC transporter permease subunit [Devosia elaeis]